MNLTITRYIDRTPDDVQNHVDQDIPVALGAAAARIDSQAVDPHGEPTADGVAVCGLDILDGALLSWEGGPRLTTLSVTVPWTPKDAVSGKKLLAANRFAEVFFTEASAAA